MEGIGSLENELLITLARSTMFSYSYEKFIYEETKSIDKTIILLKLPRSLMQAEAMISLMEFCALEQFFGTNI